MTTLAVDPARTMSDNSINGEIDKRENLKKSINANTSNFANIPKTAEDQLIATFPSAYSALSHLGAHDEETCHGMLKVLQAGLEKNINTDNQGKGASGADSALLKCMVSLPGREGEEEQVYSHRQPIGRDAAELWDFEEIEKELEKSGFLEEDGKYKTLSDLEKLYEETEELRDNEMILPAIQALDEDVCLIGWAMTKREKLHLFSFPVTVTLGRVGKVGSPGLVDTYFDGRKLGFSEENLPSVFDLYKFTHKIWKENVDEYVAVNGLWMEHFLKWPDGGVLQQTQMTLQQTF